MPLAPLFPKNPHLQALIDKLPVLENDIDGDTGYPDQASWSVASRFQTKNGRPGIVIPVEIHETMDLAGEHHMARSRIMLTIFQRYNEEGSPIYEAANHKAVMLRMENEGFGYLNGGRLFNRVFTFNEQRAQEVLQNLLTFGFVKYEVPNPWHVNEKDIQKEVKLLNARDVEYTTRLLAEKRKVS